MLSLIKNLFKKKTKSLPEENKFDGQLIDSEKLKFTDSVEGQDLNFSVEIITTVKSTSKIEPNEEISLSTIKKQATRIKKENGISEAIKYLQNYIANDKIDINNLSYLLEKLIPYMIKEKSLSEDDITSYVLEQYSKYSEKEKKEAINFHNDVSKLLKIINVQRAVSFLNETIGIFKLNNDDPSLFNPIILLAEFNLEAKKPDEAFQLTRRALLMVTNFNDKESYLSKQSIITDLQARICYEGYSPPKYRDYCYHSLINYFLEICISLNNFPHSLVFFEDLKNDFQNFNWSLANEIDNILENTSGIKNKNKFLNDIYATAFTVVPELIGLPKKYLNPNIIDQTENNESERNMLYKLITAFEERPFKEIAKIHELTSKLISKYLDKDQE